MQMLELTTYHNGDTIWLAPQHITSIYDNPHGYTTVTTVDCVESDDYFSIKQSAEHIVGLIRQHT